MEVHGCIHFGRLGDPEKLDHRDAGRGRGSQIGKYWKPENDASLRVKSIFELGKRMPECVFQQRPELVHRCSHEWQQSCVY